MKRCRTLGQPGEHADCQISITKLRIGHSC
jgi:hypothetical protein